MFLVITKIRNRKNIDILKKNFAAVRKYSKIVWDVASRIRKEKQLPNIAFV